MTFLKIFVMMISAVSLVFAQTRSPVAIDLCGVSLGIGTTKAVVFDKLGKDCNLTKVDSIGPDAWVVVDNGPKKTAKGAVVFQNGKVSSVKRSWAPDSSASDDFARALVVAMDKTIGPGKSSPSSVVTKITHGQDFDFYELSIFLPSSHELSVSVMQDVSTRKTVLLDIEESVNAK
jgi:hypothetical protein